MNWKLGKIVAGGCHFPIKRVEGLLTNLCKKILFEIGEMDPKRLTEIMTGDEIWIPFNEPLFKEKNKVYVLEKARALLILSLDSETRKSYTQCCK